MCRGFWIVDEQLCHITAFYRFNQRIIGDFSQRISQCIGLFRHLSATCIGQVFPFSTYAKTKQYGKKIGDSRHNNCDQDNSTASLTVPAFSSGTGEAKGAKSQFGQEGKNANEND